MVGQEELIGGMEEDSRAGMCQTKIGVQSKEAGTYRGTTQCFVDFVHHAREGVKIRSSLSGLLELALKKGKDIVEGEAALAGGAHVTAHAVESAEALPLHDASALRLTGSALCSSKVECGIGGGGCGRSPSGETNHGRIGLMLPCAGCGLRILLRDDADDACGDLVVDDRLVVFTHDINAEFLGRRQMGGDGRQNEGKRDAPRYRLS